MTISTTTGILLAMKILLFSDLHFWKKTASYLEPTVSGWINSMILDQNPDLVVFGGDLNHTHNSVDTDVLHAITRSMATVAATAKNVTGRPLLALSGNHDTALRGMQKNFVEALANISPHIQSITEPSLIEGILFIPYPDGSDYFAKHVEGLGEHGPDTAVVHVELSDVRYTPASDHTSDNPVTIPESVKTVLAGHYHHPEDYVVAGKKIHVIGSPCYHTYSDMVVDNPRGLVVFDTDSHTLKRFENPLGPVFHTEHAETVKTLFDREGLSRYNLRVRVDSKKQYESIQDDLEALRELCMSVRVIGKTTDVSQALVREETKTLDMKNTDEVFGAFCAKNSITDRLKDVGKSILTEVLS